MRLNSESIEIILERFDRRDDADADYIMAHWREAVDVYEHDGSMLGLDNIVRLETVLGDRIGYDATTGSTPLWKTSGNGWSKACSCARRRMARVGRPAPAASLSTGSADDWTNGSEPRPSTPTPLHVDGRAGGPVRTRRHAGLGGGRAGAGRRGPLLELPGRKEQLHGVLFAPGLHLRILRGMEGGTAVGRRPRTHGPRGHGSARRPARIRRDHADTLNGNL